MNDMDVASYTLDPVGNRTAASSNFSGFSPIAGIYNADDQLASETYDLDGNVTLAANGNSYTYDSQNHMTSANNGAVRLIYDGDGNRVAKIVNGVTTQYLVDDLNPTGYPQVVEELVSGSVLRTYAYGLQRISQNQIIDNQWVTIYYGYDGAGNVRQLINASGVVTDTYDYDAFGNVINKSGTTQNNYLYRGEQFDPDLGMYYLRARWYNPLTGRFLSRDPEEGQFWEPKTLHKYLYARGDPVNGIDPMGRGDQVEYVMFSTEVDLTIAPRAHLIAVGITAGFCAITARLDWLAKYQLFGLGGYETPEPFYGYCTWFH